MIYYLSETDVEAVVSQKEITEAVLDGLLNLAQQQACNFPVVRQSLEYQNAVFGFKSGFDWATPVLGIKAGGLWPANRSKGLANHQSTIVLFEPDTGAPKALVCGTYLTGLRTAAASALSVRFLAREDVNTLGITAAGGQAEYQLRACLAERSFERLLLPARESGSSAVLRDRLMKKDLPIEGLSIEVLPMETLCRESDVLITLAASFTPYIRSSWIQPGTHLACMGTDTVGKQELDTELFRRCSVFGDAPDQNVVLGECQHAAIAGFLNEEQIVPIGSVARGTEEGRKKANEITLFDSTGMGVQDLAAAQLALRKAQALGQGIQLDQYGASP
ncbi:MAG: ornithine cyclodeaminase family protein [Pseudomonadota bacterium]